VTTAILALEKDLFFSVKIHDTLRHHDMDVTTVRTLVSLEQGLAASGDAKPALVIVNIASKGVDWEAAIRTVRTHGLPVLAFGSHMDLDARARALQAGAQKVVANSKFAKDMPGLVQRLLNSSVENTSAAVSDDTDDEEEE
jgi:hypothetical protein